MFMLNLTPVGQQEDKTISVNGVEYEIPTRQATAIASILARAFFTFGKPETVVSENGKKLMTVIIAAWEDSFPAESDTWYNQRRAELANQRSLHDSVVAGGSNSITYPYWLFQMMNWAFPNDRWANKETVSYLWDNFPVFRSSNYTGANYKKSKGEQL